MQDKIRKWIRVKVSQKPFRIKFDRSCRHQSCAENEYVYVVQNKAYKTKELPKLRFLCLVSEFYRFPILGFQGANDLKKKNL